MVSDGEANFVYVSDLLARRFPSVYEGLERILADHGIGFGIVQGTKDIWIRDYAPIQVDQDGSFVAFRYLPDYLRHGYQHLITDARKFIPDIPGIRSCEFSDITLDVGNVVRHHDKAIVTDKVFRENRGVGRAELRQELQRLLKVETLIVIPTEPGDVVGHADGVVRFVDGGRVLVNDYSRVDGRYGESLSRVFRGAGLAVMKSPYRPCLGICRGMPPATGNYVNYIHLHGLIVFPVYGLPEDEEASNILARAFPDLKILRLDARDLALQGGVYNCITWSVFSGQ
jgi:agmatine/peptidylarginine deiminase